MKEISLESQRSYDARPKSTGSKDPVRDTPRRLFRQRSLRMIHLDKVHERVERRLFAVVEDCSKRKVIHRETLGI